MLHTSPHTHNFLTARWTTHFQTHRVTQKGIFFFIFLLFAFKKLIFVLCSFRTWLIGGSQWTWCWRWLLVSATDSLSFSLPKTWGNLSQFLFMYLWIRSLRYFFDLILIWITNRLTWCSCSGSNKSTKNRNQFPPSSLPVSNILRILRLKDPDRSQNNSQSQNMDQWCKDGTKLQQMISPSSEPEVQHLTCSNKLIIFKSNLIVFVFGQFVVV